MPRKMPSAIDDVQTSISKEVQGMREWADRCPIFVGRGGWEVPRASGREEIGGVPRVWVGWVSAAFEQRLCVVSNNECAFSEWMCVPDMVPMAM